MPMTAIKVRSKSSAAAKPKPLSLADFQASFQQAVLAGDDSILDLIPPNSRTSNSVLLGVYRHAYAGRLVEVIANDHEVLKTYVGDEYFDTMARAFVAAHPSRSQNARWFAEPLPDFLSQTEPFSFNPQLGELARLERALGSAFDAPDADVVTLAALQAIDPAKWERLVFTAHPSVRLLQMRTNALDIWTALRGAETPPDLEVPDTPRSVLVWRHELVPMVRALEAEEAMMWTESMKGVPFGKLCELLAVFDDPDTAAIRAAHILQGWLASSVLSSARLARAARKSLSAIITN